MLSMIAKTIKTEDFVVQIEHVLSPFPIPTSCGSVNGKKKRDLGNKSANVSRFFFSYVVSCV